MKHNIIYSIVLSVVLISCGGGDSGGTTPTPTPTIKPATNTAPTVPALTSPTNSKLCIDNTIRFEWNVSTDAESNAIVYQIQIASDAEFTKIVETKEVSNPFYSVALEKGKAYYWRVRATDSNSASSAYSSTFNLYTEGIALTNHLPFAPQLVAPENNTTITGLTTTLSWTGSDADASDLLSYDVYLGTETNPITKVVDNKTVKTYTATLLATKIYYWRVVVNDGKGGKTEGQVWSFKTN